MERWRSSRGPERPIPVAITGVLVLVLAACTSVSTPTATLPPAPLPGVPASAEASSAIPSARPSTSPSPSASPTPSPSAEESGLEVISFDVAGTVGGKSLAGTVTNGSLTVPCAGAGANQVLAVHWAGTAPPTNTQLQGEIDLKPGSWTFGSSGAQGIATVGLAGGKPADDLVATSGTVTTAQNGGKIDATFTGGTDSLHVSGSWICPPA